MLTFASASKLDTLDIGNGPLYSLVEEDDATVVCHVFVHDRPEILIRHIELKRTVNNLNSIYVPRTQM